jgi:lipopolysaccharide biosynthesis protein
MSKTLILFVYAERNNKIIKDNLRFFLKCGLIKNDNYHYVFILNGESSIEIPNRKNISIIERDNVGLDFGAWGAALSSVDINNYDYFIFINDTARGPFVPMYTKNDWIDMFLSRLNKKTKLVGPTINLQYHIHVQSMCFCTDNIGLNLLLKNDIFLLNEKESTLTRSQKKRYIIKHEVRMSKIIIENGYEIESFQLSYLGGEKNESDSQYTNGYFGTTLNPLEIMFIKTNRINDKIVKNYTRWFMNANKD